VSWCSSVYIVSGYGLKDWGSTLNWTENFLVVVTYSLVVIPGIKRWKHAANHSSPTGVEIKNGLY